MTATRQLDAHAYIESGQTPFFRLAPGGNASAGTDPTATSAVLLGVPYDGGVTYQPGARFAPYQVRRVSALIQSVHPTYGIDVFARVSVVDGGNVAASAFHPDQSRELIQMRVAEVARSGAAPLIIGGDHSITLPCLRAIAAVRGPVALVHVDAHADTSDARTWGNAYHHGTPIRHALDEGLVAPGQLYQIGLRTPWATLDEARWAKERGARVFDMDAVSKRGIPDVMREIRQRVGDLGVYISFDVDAIDPAFAPGTGTPVPGGLTSREALQLVRELAGSQVVGMDVVEVCPMLDHADQTSLLAAYLLYEGLALLALRGAADAARS